MKTIEDFYKELLSVNPSWLNPVLKPFDNECLADFYFRVDVKGFDEIRLIPGLRINSIFKFKKNTRTSTFTIWFELVR